MFFCHNSSACRSEVWRCQKPVYVTKGEKVARVEGLDVKFRARSKSICPETFKKRFEFVAGFNIQGVSFNWYPPEKLKYGKPRLGVSTLT